MRYPCVIYKPKATNEAFRVYAHYETSKEVSAKYGMSAPRLDSNMWDCWWCVAMMLSDYWITVAGDPDMAYQMAYEYLSDPDRK